MAGLWKAYKEGGVLMMSIILVWSIFTIGIIIERALYLYGSSINKDVFLATMQKCILAGDVAKAVKMCSAANAPLARIVQAGLVKVNRPDEDHDAVWVAEAWRTQDAHAASLEREDVRAVIARAAPLLAGSPEAIRVEPLGGKGLPET